MAERIGVMRQSLTSVGVLIAFWLLGFLAARVSQSFSGREFSQAFATALALALAVYLRVRLVALFLAAMLAFNLSELAIHSIYAEDVVRGAPAHFAVMAAGVSGVVLGLAVDRAIHRNRAAA